MWAFFYRRFIRKPINTLEFIQMIRNKNFDFRFYNLTQIRWNFFEKYERLYYHNRHKDSFYFGQGKKCRELFDILDENILDLSFSNIGCMDLYLDQLWFKINVFGCKMDRKTKAMLSNNLYVYRIPSMKLRQLLNFLHQIKTYFVVIYKDLYRE